LLLHHLPHGGSGLPRCLVLLGYLA